MRGAWQMSFLHCISTFDPSKPFSMILFSNMSVDELMDILTQKAARCSELEKLVANAPSNSPLSQEYFALKDDVAELRTEIHRRYKARYAAESIGQSK